MKSSQIKLLYSCFGKWNGERYKCVKCPFQRRCFDEMMEGFAQSKKHKS